ncbi:MAG: hypothetical protein AAGG51_26455 [Cyanobacteria bacterium P01_G01_bin.54]
MPSPRSRSSRSRNAKGGAKNKFKRGKTVKGSKKALPPALQSLLLGLAIALGISVGFLWGQQQQALRLGLLVGIALGFGLGLVIEQSTSRSAKTLLSLPSWRSLLGSMLVAVAIGAIANPQVFLLYARQAGIEPWHPSYPQVGAAPGFRLYTDRPNPEQDQKIQRFLTQFRTTVAARFLNPGPDSCAVEVYLLRDEANYQAILRNFHIRTPYGFFSTLPNPPSLFVRDSTGLGTLTHEMMHHFVYCTFPAGLPTWVDEGVATLMEKFIAIERDGQLTFSWGYRSNSRDPEVRHKMSIINLATALSEGKDQDFFNAFFLMLYHQNHLAPLLIQLHANPDETGFSTLMATLKASSLPDIQWQWQQWMQTDALALPMLELSFVAWANETEPVDRHLQQYWQWDTQKQMWLSPRREPQAVIPSKENMARYQ